MSGSDTFLTTGVRGAFSDSLSLRPRFSEEAWTRESSGRSGLFSNDPSGWCQAGPQVWALLSSDLPGWSRPGQRVSALLSNGPSGWYPASREVWALWSSDPSGWCRVGRRVVALFSSDQSIFLFRFAQ